MSSTLLWCIIKRNYFKTRQNSLEVSNPEIFPLIWTILTLHYCTVFMDPGHFRPIFILIRNFTSYKMKSKYSQSDWWGVRWPPATGCSCGEEEGWLPIIYLASESEKNCFWIPTAAFSHQEPGGDTQKSGDLSHDDNGNAPCSHQAQSL